MWNKTRSRISYRSQRGFTIQSGCGSAVVYSPHRYDVLCTAWLFCSMVHKRTLGTAKVSDRRHHSHPLTYRLIYRMVEDITGYACVGRQYKTDLGHVRPVGNRPIQCNYNIASRRTVPVKQAHSGGYSVEVRHAGCSNNVCHNGAVRDRT